MISLAYAMVALAWLAISARLLTDGSADHTGSHRDRLLTDGAGAGAGAWRMRMIPIPKAPESRSENDSRFHSQHSQAGAGENDSHYHSENTDPRQERMILVFILDTARQATIENDSHYDSQENDSHYGYRPLQTALYTPLASCKKFRQQYASSELQKRRQYASIELKKLALIRL